MKRVIVIVLAVFALATMSAGAQSKDKTPRRPGLPAGADTNDASAYWRLGVSKLVEDPYKASDAFYWATQINPTWADGYYGEWVAEWLQNPSDLFAMEEGDEGSKGIEKAAHIDSLRLKALTLNPFLYERLERTMIEQMFSSRFSGAQRGEVEVAMQQVWNRGPMMRAVSAYTRGMFHIALANYDTVLSEIERDGRDDTKKKDADLRASRRAYAIATIDLDRGRIFYLAGNFESAAVELQQAALGKEVSEKKRVVRVYESKAIIQQSLGLTFEQLHKPDSAREAYGRALEEDLSYAPAHLAMSGLALAKGDTTQALSELDLAAQMSPNDPATAFFYGRALILSGHDKEAMEQLQRSVKLAPHFAAPHALLAFIYDGAEYQDEARAEYQAYLGLTVPNDQYVAKAKERMIALAPKDSTKP